jgi:hypothetical protein
MEQLTLDIKVSNDNEPLKKILPNIRINHGKASASNSSTTSNYLSRRVKSIRYLNSKTLFDRIYKHFQRVLKFEWMQYIDEKNNDDNNNNNINTNNNINNNTNSFNKASTTYFDREKSHELKDNQMRIRFKWKGLKQRDLEILLVINLALKFSDKEFENRILNSMISISNNFFQYGGVFTQVPLINEQSMKFIIK